MLNDFIERLKNNDVNLVSLDLRKKNIGINDAEKLASALITNTVLKEINLNGTNVKAWFTDLIHVLKNNETLQILRLSDTNLGVDEASKLATVLSTSNSSLEVLELNGNAIGDEGFILLLNAIRINLTVTHLALHNTAIGDESAMLLSSILKAHPTLTHLNIGYSNIHTRGFTALSQALTKNRSMQSFALDGHCFSDTSITALIEALKTNKSLNYLSLCDCSIENKYAQDLFAMIKENPFLIKLDLTDNNIEPKDLEIFAEDLLQTNFIIQEFVGVSNSTISTYLQRNKKITTCINSLIAIAEGREQLEVDKIVTALNELNELVPCLTSLNYEHPIAQVYRLFTGLAFKENLNSIDELNALQCLLPRFTDPELQKIADLPLGELLYHGFSELFQQTNRDTQKAFHLLVLHCLTAHKDLPQVTLMIYDTLLKLNNVDELSSVDEVYWMSKNIFLLNYKEIMPLLKEALIMVEQSESKGEKQLVQLLWGYNHAPLDIINNLMQLPTLALLLHERYPRGLVLENALIQLAQQNKPHMQPWAKFEILTYTQKLEPSSVFSSILHTSRELLLSILNLWINKEEIHVVGKESASSTQRFFSQQTRNSSPETTTCLEKISPVLR